MRTWPRCGTALRWARPVAGLPRGQVWWRGLRVHGPWAKPKIKPDLKKLLEDPEATAKAVEQIGKAVKGLKGKDSGGVNELLKGVLGGGQQQQGTAPAQGGAQPQPQPQQQQQVNPEALIRNLLGR